MAIYRFRGRLLEKAKLESLPEGAKLWNEKFKPFAGWASKEHPQELSREETGGYSAENARLFCLFCRSGEIKHKNNLAGEEGKG